MSGEGDYPLADQLRDALVAAQGYLDAKDQLLAHCRSGNLPSEAFWRRYTEARTRWESVKEAARTATHAAGAA